MISVITPVLNEEKHLPAALSNILAQSGSYEVIVVDGGSTDRTREIVRDYPQVRLLVSMPGRGRQMNRGAQFATGDLLLFLHADTMLPPHALEKLNCLESDPDLQFGGFHHHFSGQLWQLRFVSWLTNMRCSLSGIFYGDQAIFVRRRLFELLGGFSAGPILEDVIFCERALKCVRPTFMPERVVTDSRKFEQMGVWRSLMRCILIIFCHQFGLPIKGQAFFSPVR